MKKNIYVKPETTVMLIETEDMIAASPGADVAPNSLDVEFSTTKTINSGSVSAKGHDSSLWDFDDEY